MKRIAYVTAAALVLTSGCYSVEPIAAAKPVPGTRVQMAINDEGRVALGGSMGPEIRRVEGNLMSQQDNEYVVSVTGVNYVNGLYQPWKGETVRIDSRLVSGFYEKKFSKGRTIAFAAAVALAATAIKPPWVKSAIPHDTTSIIHVDESRRPIGQIRIVIPR